LHHERLVEMAAALLDEPAQVAAELVGHHHVHGAVGPEDVGDVDDVGMLDRRQRARLGEELLHALHEALLRLLGDRLDAPARRAVDQSLGAVFLDHHLAPAALPDREVDEGKTPAAEHLGDAVAFERVALPQRAALCGGHVTKAVSCNCGRHCRPWTAPAFAGARQFTKIKGILGSVLPPWQAVSAARRGPRWPHDNRATYNTA